MIKEQIASSLLNAQEESLSSSVTSVSSVSSVFSSTSQVVLEPSFSYTSPSLASVETTAQPSVIVNVASNVRVASGPGDTSAITVTPVTTLSPDTASDIVTSVSQSDDSDVTVATVLPAPVAPLPGVQSSVLTVYISGRVPGVFTTSLSTIFYNGAPPDDNHDNSDKSDRVKRHVEAVITPTKTVKLDSDLSDHYFELIESGLNSYDEASKDCDDTKTVTVTETVTQCSLLF